MKLKFLEMRFFQAKTLGFKQTLDKQIESNQARNMTKNITKP